MSDECLLRTHARRASERCWTHFVRVWVGAWSDHPFGQTIADCGQVVCFYARVIEDVPGQYGSLSCEKSFAATPKTKMEI
jgi:hypothetical protein